MADEATIDWVLAAMQRARESVESERLAMFAPFGVDPACRWPASQVYHKQSSFGPAWYSAVTFEQAEQLTMDQNYKVYGGAPRVPLPRSPAVDTPLEVVVRARKSCRSFAKTPLDLKRLGKLLELSSGITDEAGPVPHRAAPSGGALYPVETYVIALDVEGLTPGVYHYVAKDHALEHVRPIRGAADLVEIIPPGLHEAGASAIVCYSGVFSRTQLKYTERGYRFILLEAGHIAQNLMLAALGLGLGSAPCGGFRDEEMNQLIGLDPLQEAVVYSMLVGVPA